MIRASSVDHRSWSIVFQNLKTRCSRRFCSPRNTIFTGDQHARRQCTLPQLPLQGVAPAGVDPASLYKEEQGAPGGPCRRCPRPRPPSPETVFESPCGLEVGTKSARGSGKLRRGAEKHSPPMIKHRGAHVGPVLAGVGSGLSLNVFVCSEFESVSTCPR